MSFTYGFVVVFGAVVVLTSGHHGSHTRGAAENHTDICKGAPCPTYEVLNKLADDLEERQYDKKDLVAYEATQCLSFNAAKTQAYYHLHMYIMGGQNVEKRRLTMGTPVITKVKHVEDVEPRCSWLHTVLFFVNETMLPAPSTPDITIKPMAGRHFYVYTYGGFTHKPEDSVLAMRVRLNARKLCYDASTYYVATYQSPRKHVHRRNEIWMPVRPCPSLTR